MKKTTLFISLLFTLFCITSCNTTPADETTPVSTDTETEEIIVPVVEEEVNPDNIVLNAIEGLNEQIVLNLAKPAAGGYTIFYKEKDGEAYVPLDKELMLENEESIDCYILGLAKGLYDVKIEGGEGETFSRKIITDIDVEKQDRTGYAHFKREEGIGGYNNDGTVKENAVILYVSNATKNTVTLDIDGTTYTGLVEILLAKQYMEQPLIIRITDKIMTNQWTERLSEPRLLDDSNLTDDFFVNTFSTEYGENLANIRHSIQDGRDGILYEFITTPDGNIALDPVVNNVVGKKGNYYNDYFYPNMIDIYNAKDLTIEGIGKTAEIFQFGLSFNQCNSIEIKNLTFSANPEDAINFMGTRGTLAEPESVKLNGNFWIHNNTFNAGYKAWLINGVGNGLVGDGRIDLNWVHGVTIAYNQFNGGEKIILVSSGDGSLCMDVTLHHNRFNKASQRMPLGRNTNIHSYNNYFYKCVYGVSSRVDNYLFMESNYFYDCAGIFYDKQQAYNVKSYNDVYDDCGLTDWEMATMVDTRDTIVENKCSPDGTDYSRFDTDPELFYYDAENGCTIADVLLDPSELKDFTNTYSGAGKYVRLDIPYVVPSESAE